MGDSLQSPVQALNQWAQPNAMANPYQVAPPTMTELMLQAGGAALNRPRTVWTARGPVQVAPGLGQSFGGALLSGLGGSLTAGRTDPTAREYAMYQDVLNQANKPPQLIDQNAPLALPGQSGGFAPAPLAPNAAGYAPPVNVPQNPLANYTPSMLMAADKNKLIASALDPQRQAQEDLARANAEFARVHSQYLAGPATAAANAQATARGVPNTWSVKQGNQETQFTFDPNTGETTREVFPINAAPAKVTTPLEEEHIRAQIAQLRASAAHLGKEANDPNSDNVKLTTAYQAFLRDRETLLARLQVLQDTPQGKAIETELADVNASIAALRPKINQVMGLPALPQRGAGGEMQSLPDPTTIKPGQTYRDTQTGDRWQVVNGKWAKAGVSKEY